MKIIKRIIEEPITQSLHYWREEELFCLCMRQSRMAIESLLSAPRFVKFLFPKVVAYLESAQKVVVQATATCERFHFERSKHGIFENKAYWSAQGNHLFACEALSEFVGEHDKVCALEDARVLADAQVIRLSGEK